MVKQIEVVVNTTIVNTKIIDVDLPTKPKFYEFMDDGKFFPRGEVLFAIIPRYKDSTSTYVLFEIERNKQNFNDFVPTKDCRSEFWLSKSNEIRNTALEILLGKSEFTEITREEFEKRRLILINQGINKFLNPDVEEL